MSSEAGTLERLTLLAGEALEGLVAHLDPIHFAELLGDFGLRLPDDFFVGGWTTNELTGASTAVGRISPLIGPLRDAIGAAASVADSAAAVSAAAAAAAEILAAVQALRELSGALSQAAPGLADLELRARLEELAPMLPRLVLERAILERLDKISSQAVPLIALTGLADDQWVPGVADDPSRVSRYSRRLHMERIAKLFTEPLTYLRETFGWGEPSFDALPYLKRVERWYHARGRLPRWVDEHDPFPMTPPALNLGWALLQTDTTQSPPGVAAVIRYEQTDDREAERPVGPWLLYSSLKSRYEAGLRVTLAPSGQLGVDATGSPTVSARAGLKLEAPDQSSVTLLALAGGTRIEARKVDLSVGVEGLQASPVLQVASEGLTLVLDAASGDSFLKSVSGGGRGRSDISVGATWSPAQGLKLTGSSALEIAVSAHARLGPATLETVYLVARLTDDALPLEISAALRGELGPFKAVVDRVGALFTASFPEDGGNLGPLQLDVGFKPPSGVGLSIEGGGCSGGGFLRRDPSTGEYAGALELVFEDVIELKAFGVLETKAAGVSSGYSLVVVVSAEFAPIQLSFGFTLLGLGGLLGVERTALHDQLRLGLRDGSLESILFPKDLVANAPRIVNDLKRLFPAQGGCYLIGPMGKLGWGTPALLTVDLGVIIEIPRPGFVILGVLRIAAPAKDVPVLDMQVNFLGVVDFERKELTFDASLYDSRLLSFTLTGDMAVRLYWGESANFLLSAGGFHPGYTPPPLGLPTLSRLTIAMCQGNPRLTAESYFALTSNTLQFGAKVELYYGVASVFTVYGFVSLDALVQFDPFRFIAEVAGQVAVRSGGSTLFAIHLVLTLEGPTPWHARGKGSFEIGFIFTVTISASFDVTFGEERHTSLPPVRVLALVEEALRADGNWRAVADLGSRRGVATRELPPDAGVVVSPTGALTASQKVAPLNLPLERMGAARIDGPNRISIVDVSLGASADPPPTRPVQEQFPPAQFLDLSDAEKLSRRSFEPFDAGVEIGGGSAPKASFQTKVDVAYEVVYAHKPRRPLRFLLRDAILDLLVAGSAAARSKRSAGKRAPSGVGTPKVALPTERFVVAGVDDLEPHAPGLTFPNESAAVIALEDAVARNPRLRGKLQVIPSYEAAA
jgi:hypothetical protein